MKHPGGASPNFAYLAYHDPRLPEALSSCESSVP